MQEYAGLLKYVWHFNGHETSKSVVLNLLRQYSYWLIVNYQTKWWILNLTASHKSNNSCCCACAYNRDGLYALLLLVGNKIYLLKCSLMAKAVRNNFSHHDEIPIKM